MNAEISETIRAGMFGSTMQNLWPPLQQIATPSLTPKSIKLYIFWKF